MSFFEDIGKRISEAGQGAARKTRDIADSARSSIMISDEEKKINGLYAELGRAYYEKYAAAEDCEFFEAVRSINEANSRIRELRQQDAVRRGMRVCTKCGAALAADSSFCNVCGAPVEAPAAAADEAVGMAPNTDETGAETAYENTAETAAEEHVAAAGEEQSAAADADVKKCHVCGTELAREAAFCKECGARQLS